ncbi:MAG: S24/S26 family peptidase [Clostridia bacterium]|nr:S24/S26 family peptidase [Clostridia bacterium]
MMENIGTVSLDEAMPFISEMLKNGNTVSLLVKGSSMFPFLISGRDKVILAAVTIPLKKGDIVLYRNHIGKYVLHRISRIDSDGNFEIIGDGQLVADYPVNIESIVARVISVERKGENLCSKNIKWKLFSSKLFLFFSRKILVKNAIKKGSVTSD